MWVLLRRDAALSEDIIHVQISFYSIELSPVIIFSVGDSKSEQFN